MTTMIIACGIIARLGTIVRDIETVRIEAGRLTMVAANVPGEAKPRVGHLTLRSAVIGTGPLSRTLEERS
jgi:hypothetical protein